MDGNGDKNSHLRIELLALIVAAICNYVEPPGSAESNVHTQKIDCPKNCNIYIRQKPKFGTETKQNRDQNEVRHEKAVVHYMTAGLDNPSFSFKN